MRQKSQKLRGKSGFIVVAELTAGAGFNFVPIEKFLENYKDAGSSAIPSEFDFVGITLPQNTGGVATIEPANVLSQIRMKDLLGELDFVPHISCKDRNSDAIISLLVGFRKVGVDSVLALTGDKPNKAKGVFELDSIGLLRLIRQMNNTALIKAKPENLEQVPQFFAGAVVSPFKYTEGSQMQQYYKMEKKVASGAEFLITQVGWDWKKSLELFMYLKENGIDTPVIGYVYLLSTTTSVLRRMHDVELPGCFVSDELLEKVYSESIDDHIERAAQQVAMYKAIGAAGVDIGGVRDFEVFARILNRAVEIGGDWEQFKDNLYWPAREVFYLYDQAGSRVKLVKNRMKLKHRIFNFMHDTVFNIEHWAGRCFKKSLALVRADKGKGFGYKAFNGIEKSVKYWLFECRQCGDCYLPENFGLCNVGGCEKSMDNPPCGDATVDGYCGNNLERICIGERIYDAAATEKNGLEKLRKIINKPRNPALEHTASIINYLFDKDHTMKNPIIYVGESVHASIPKTGKIMKELADLGSDSYTRPSPQLDYIKALIQSQAKDGSDYIAVNLDAFGESDPHITVDMMVEYVKMVRKWAGGIAVCIDSSDDNVLMAGLKEWYNTAEAVKPPLLNSVKVYTMHNILPLKKHYDFSVIGLLVSEEKASAPGGSHSVDERV
ncbi:MAG: methylenetetrahydrofolate reductase C-terminal domain-containing protein [Planctomycetota bacterium]|jgi:methylenetetrahydrofolate reductase (NADPH)